jgi:hypothetical protein
MKHARDLVHLETDNITKGCPPTVTALLFFVFAGGLSGLKDGGMVDRVGLSAWRRRRRAQRQHHAAPHSSSHSVPPCLVHIIERSSPFSGADDAEASGEEAVQVMHCPKSGVNFFDLGDFERQFDIAKQRAHSNLEIYLAGLNSSSSSQQLQQQQQQPLAASNNQGVRDSQQQQQARSSVVLPSARRSAAAAAAVASTSPGSRRGTTSGSPSKATSSM